MSPKVSILDLILESLSFIASSKIRTILTMLGTIIGVTTFIAISGIGSTANGQIAKDFNELQATHITVADYDTKNNHINNYNFPKDASQRIERLNGVKAAGVYYQIPGIGNQDEKEIISNQPAINNPHDYSNVLSLFAASGHTINAIDAKFKSGVNFNDIYEEYEMPVAILGSIAAQKLGVTSVITNPIVFVNNQAYNVVGILDDADASFGWVNTAVILPINTSLKAYGLPSPESPANMIIHTDLGAAKLLSIQAPFALRPDNPNLLEGYGPPDWSVATQGATDSLNILLIILSILAMIIGGVAIANTTLVSVMQRRGEIGLRTALGAKPSHIYGQILMESGILGLIGAVLGQAIGIFIVIGISIASAWTPVLDPAYLIITPIFGVFVGVLAGLYPAHLATKVNPSEALMSF